MIWKIRIVWEIFLRTDIGIKMVDNRGQIQKRLEDNMCPWCMSKLALTQKKYEDDLCVITRKCSSCSGTVVDTFKHKVER